MADSPPKLPPTKLKYAARYGTRLQKEQAAAGRAFDFPEDPRYVGQWIVGECIGKGGSGRVRIAKHRHSGQLAALKIIPFLPVVDSQILPRLSAKARLGIDKEIILLKLMDHPNIIRIYDVFEGEQELYLVLEYIEGGELFDFLTNHGRLSSREALVFFKQIVYGLNYAHTLSIIHRDLKLENILIQSLTPPLIKIADWGMATFAAPSVLLETSCGSPHYASPEIVSGSEYQGSAIDVWSCGVILYALLVGKFPFDDRDVRVLLSKIKEGHYEIPSFVDPQAKDLLERMLVVDAAARITLPEIIAHPWFNRLTLSIPYVPPPMVTEMVQPLASEAQIDDNLLQCLRVMWGKHGAVESIKSDLLSPQSSLAKAFYFLLRRHHEQTLADSDTIDSRISNFRLPGKAISKRYQPPTLTKQNELNGQQCLPGLTIQTYGDLSSSNTHTRGFARPPISPTGPRPPKIQHPLPSTVSTAPTRHRSVRAAPVSMTPPNAHVEVGVHRTRSVSTRPTPLNRGSPIHTQEPYQRMDNLGTSTIRFPVVSNFAEPVLSPNVAYAPPTTFAIGTMHDNVSISRFTFMERHEIRTAPGYGPGEAHDILEPYSVAQVHDLRFTHAHKHSDISVGPSMQSHFSDRHAHAPASSDTRFRREDKENITRFDDQPLKTDWQPSGKLFAKSIGGVFRQQNENLQGQQNPISSAKGKETKGRSSAKRPAPSFQHQVDAPSAREPKGWFTNLLHRKVHTYMLYSTASLRVTQYETRRILKQLGVEIDEASEGSHYDRRQSNSSILHCQAYELIDRPNNALVLKYVRFRIEFLALGTTQVNGFLAPPMPTTSAEVGSYSLHPAGFGAPSSATSTMLTSSRHIASAVVVTDGASYPTCEVVLTQERGSGSAFRALCHQICEIWTLDRMVSSYKGPKAPGSLVGSQQRMVIMS